MPAPTLAAPSNAATGAPSQPAQGGQAQAAALLVPFTRASRKKSRLAGSFGPITLNTTVQALPPIQLPAAGFLRAVKLTVTGTTAGNAATVAFSPDGPFNVLQQISLLSANGDSLISPIDGFALYCLIKYGAFSTGRYDPLGDPTYSAVTGVGGGVGGSFKFNIAIPVEVDARDAFCALQNMAANQSFLLQLSLNSIAGLYPTTPPTTPPTVTIVITMLYWAAPAPQNANGDGQATFPPGNGSVSLIQTQQPTIAPGTQQNIQLLNVGNTVRFVLFILRNATLVRDEADWPNVANIYVNNDPWYYKTKDQWLSDMAQFYDYDAGITAAPTLNSLDNGVRILADFMNDGASGDGNVDGATNRNLYLNTLSSTAFNFEAVSWGSGSASLSLQIITNAIRPSSAAGMYQPSFI